MFLFLFWLKIYSIEKTICIVNEFKTLVSKTRNSNIYVLQMF